VPHGRSQRATGGLDGTPNNRRAICNTSSTTGASSFCLPCRSKDWPPQSWHARLDSSLMIGASTTDIRRCYWKPWWMPKDFQEPAIALRIGFTWARLPEELGRIAFVYRIPKPTSWSLFFRYTVALSSCCASTIRHRRYPKLRSEAVNKYPYFRSCDAPIPLKKVSASIAAVFCGRVK